jgi:hypothetical protein
MIASGAQAATRALARALARTWVRMRQSVNRGRITAA